MQVAIAIMPLFTEIPRDSLHYEELFETVVECTDEDGWGPEALYDQNYEEGSKICDPKDFQLGYDGVHWCLQYTKEAFVEAWYMIKEEYYGQYDPNDDNGAGDIDVAPGAGDGAIAPGAVAPGAVAPGAVAPVAPEDVAPGIITPDSSF